MEKIIDNFLNSLERQTKKTFTIRCDKCDSENITFYNNVRRGSAYTGTYGNAGIKCIDCGNAMDIYEA